MYSSKVISGNQLGRKIGFPTFNLFLNQLSVEFGVYLVSVSFQGFDGFGLMHYGPRKSVDDKVSIEIHVINYNSFEDVFELNFEILTKIREVKKFSNLSELKNQIMIDKTFALNYLENI